MPDITSIVSHIPIGWLAAGWVFSIAAQSLPAPDAESGKFYRWLFTFVNSLGANMSQLVAHKIGGTAPIPPKQ
jgi:hypothetical protein